MTFTFLKIIGMGFMLSVSTLANATLIDNGDYTTDTESGLDWLDWTLTVNKTQAEALTIFSAAGWRVATGTEARGLLGDFFEVDLTGQTFLPSFAISGTQRTDFRQLFGSTAAPWSYATIVDFGLIGLGLKLWIGYQGSAQYGEEDFKGGSFGVALVKPTAVSEPAIITLFALGCVGIGFARRRQS
jgi:hypothetical protein